MVKKLSEEEEFTERENGYKEWQQSLELPTHFSPGEMLDVRDTLFFWCMGTVKQVLSGKDDSPQVLLIHYPGWNAIYNEFIPANSPRLAPLGRFSSRKDLPQYNDSLFNLPRTIFQNEIPNLEVQFI
jgi:hypothetical protein